MESGFVGGISSEAEDVDEGAEVELTRNTCSVNDGDDLAGLRLEIEGFDGVHELIDGDVSAAVVVENIENLFEFGDCFGIEVLFDVFRAVERGLYSWL